MFLSSKHDLSVDVPALIYAPVTQYKRYLKENISQKMLPIGTWEKEKSDIRVIRQI